MVKRNRKQLSWKLSPLFVLIAVVLLVIGNFTFAAVDQSQTDEVDRLLKSADELNGQPLFSEQSLSKPTVVIFLGQECPISRRFVPRLNELHVMAKAKGIQLIGAFADSWATQESSERFRSDYEIEFPLYLDKEQKLARLLKPKAKPEAFVLGADWQLVYRGRIDDRFVAIGRLKSKFDQHDLSNAIDAVARGEAPEVAVTEPVGCLYGEW